MGAPGERVQAGVDGELITFEAPLRFSVDPGALRMLVPEGLPTDRQVPPLQTGLHAARTLRSWLRPALAVQEESGSDDPHSRMYPDIVGAQDRLRQWGEEDQNSQDHGGWKNPTME